MRFVLCIVIAALLPGSALAAKGGTMSFSRTQAAAALATTTYRQACISGCSARGHRKGQCVRACRPGLCHLGGKEPYCVAK